MLSSMAGRQISGDMRQGDVRDAGVQHFHERRERDDQRDHPRIVFRAPHEPALVAAAFLNVSVALMRFSYCKCTEGVTDMPWRSRWSPILARIERDANRDPLHHLHVICQSRFQAEAG